MLSEVRGEAGTEGEDVEEGGWTMEPRGGCCWDSGGRLECFSLAGWRAWEGIRVATLLTEQRL
jgi:hypothetical protein